MKKYRSISWFAVLLCLVLVVTGCSKEMSSSFSDDDEIKPGDPVIFTTYVPVKAMTRYADEAEFNSDIATYSPTTESYAFTYVMYKYGVEDPIASGPQVYWPDNVNAYGFKATAGTDAVASDQTTDAKLLLQDKLLGYGFEPLWSGDAPVDNIEGLNYRTCVDWKAANVSRSVAEADRKKIPLYLKHQRSKITIILKAGEGVARTDLASETAGTNIDATIYSYPGPTAVKPNASSTTVDYTDATGVETTQYTAIVEPYDYQTETTTGDGGQVIAEIKLSGQRFTFKPSNETADDKSNYNLTAGKHLVITATLARGNAQKVLLTAQVVPWTEVSIDATVGDDGQIGTTTDINDLAALKAFLLDNDKNTTANCSLPSGIIGETKFEGTSGQIHSANLILDVNAWKSALQSKLLAGQGTAGNMTIFKDAPANHNEFLQHCTAERPNKLTGRFGTIDVWRLLPNRLNHYWDTLVYATAAGSMVAMAGSPSNNPRINGQFERRRMAAADRQRKAKNWGG